MAFTHIGPVTVTHTNVANATPKFGETFTIVDLDFDDKGHKAGSGTHTITIPQPSLTDNAAAGNVLTGLSLTANTGVFTTSRANVSTLALTGYSEAASNPLLKATDTVGEAFKKLETVLDNETTSVNTRISNNISTFKGNSNDTDTTTVYGIVNSTKQTLLDYIASAISESTRPTNP